MEWPSKKCYWRDTLSATGPVSRNFEIMHLTVLSEIGSLSGCRLLKSAALTWKLRSPDIKVTSILSSVVKAIFSYLQQKCCNFWTVTATSNLFTEMDLAENSDVFWYITRPLFHKINWLRFKMADFKMAPIFGTYRKRWATSPIPYWNIQVSQFLQSFWNNTVYCDFWFTLYSSCDQNSPFKMQYASPALYTHSINTSSSFGIIAQVGSLASSKIFLHISLSWVFLL